MFNATLFKGERFYAAVLKIEITIISTGRKHVRKYGLECVDRDRGTIMWICWMIGHGSNRHGWLASGQA